MHIASKRNFIEMAKLLLKHGVDLSLRDVAQKYALNYAVEAGHHEMAILLIANGRELLISHNAQ